MPGSFNPFANIFYMTNTYFPWKGKTFTQISSAIQINRNNAVRLTPRQLRMPLPLKIYRRELAIYGASHTDISNNPLFLSNRRISNKIDYFNMPGSTVISSKTANPVGICDTMDLNIPNNTSELPGICKTGCTGQTCITDQACNARKRVRSAGMIKRVYNATKNNASYCTNTNQYLISRNLAFSSNEFAYLRQGNTSLKPGPGTAATNIYSAGGLSFCNSIVINSTNNQFSYVWINGTTYNINIPNGSYNLNSFISLFNAQVFNNQTFLLNISTGQTASLLTIGYDNVTNLIYLQSASANNPLYLNQYIDKSNPGINTAITTGSLMRYMPYFIIPNTGIQNVIGFTAGNYNQYVNVSAPLNAQSPSNIPHSIQPNYVRMNYKPSNSKFAQQGAVSASARLLRKKYDTITNNANTLRNPLGNAAANAMAYGVSEDPYTVKAQLGYTNIKYPHYKNGKMISISEKQRKCG